MKDLSRIDYSILDRPEVLKLLFYPRREERNGSPPASSIDVLIPVEEGVELGARFHSADKAAPNILFFHGNGEIVADYDELGALYNRMAINFFPVDYRGYGRSTGEPTVTAMIRDCHVVFEFFTRWLNEKSYSGPMIVMGRSLGSASALELANCYKDRVAGLIIESGFAYAAPLLRLLGVDVSKLGFTEEMGFRNVDKIAFFDKPTLIIHAEKDRIIPFSDAEALYRASRASLKTLVEIVGAGHNDLFAHGFKQYMTAIGTMIDTVKKEIAQRAK